MDRPIRRVADGWILALWAVTTAAMCFAIWMVFEHAPEERVMGAVQKIFYFHVPSAMMTYAGVFVMLSASIGYLWTRDRRWDALSRAATEVGILFCTVVMMTGPIWAKPAWGVWWTWEARLTSMLVLWLLLIACLMVRDYADNKDLGARLAAIVGIVAALDVPIIHKAVNWWRGQHPVVFEPNKKSALAPEMMETFRYCIVVFLLLFVLLLVMRYRTLRHEDRADTAIERLSMLLH